MVETKSVTTRESLNRNRVWEQFFPNSYRKNLAQQLAGKISTLDYVREIVAVSYAPTTPESNFFIVIVSDNILDEEHALGDCASRVFEEWENVRSNGNKGVLITPPYIRTESEFESLVSDVLFKDSKFGTLWSAPAHFTP